jgi:predicted acetyltransferase
MAWDVKKIRARRAQRDKKSIMADQSAIRPISDDEYVAFRRVQQHAFNTGPSPAANLPRVRRQFERDRSLAAFDPGQPAEAGPVGTAGVYSLRMTVPGAMLPVAGVTMVSVLPTHRRRGILRSLMRRQLADIAERGEEPIAALWASETPLYGRYGYGRASSHAFFRFGRGEGALHAAAPADPAITLRLAEPADAVAELAKVYETVLPGQPGFFGRDADWWDRVLDDPEEERHGASPLRCLLAEDGNGVRAYALYLSTPRWEEGTFLADSALSLWELVAADPAGGAALWRDLLSRDLITEVTARLRPEDDPLLHLLADPRRARPAIADGLWFRVVDVPGALSLRRYPCPVDVVIEVIDDWCPWNQGRWRLTAGSPGGTASCERTSDPADVILPVTALGAAYLGSTRLGSLAAAGLVTEQRASTLNALSAAMTWDPGPWCPVIF